ncbi:hypothetical protein, partial [Bacteroides sp.]
SLSFCDIKYNPLPTLSVSSPYQARAKSVPNSVVSVWRWYGDDAFLVQFEGGEQQETHLNNNNFVYQICTQ